MKYHKSLACYFDDKPLYLDIPTQKKPNTRKLVEQPWQQIKGKLLLNKITVTLCDLSFIQAKCQAGMTYQLVWDYDHATTSLMLDSDSITSIQKDWEVLDNYAKALLKYSSENAWVKGSQHKTQQLPVLSTEAGERNGFGSDKDKNSDLSRLLEYGRFVRASAAIFNEFSLFPGFCIQHIYNSINKGVMALAAEKIINSTDFQSPIFLRVEESRYSYEENPALVMRLYTYSDISTLALTPDATRIVAGDRKGTLRIWNTKNGECLKTVPLTSPYYHTDGLAISSDASIAVTAPDSSDKVLRVWNLLTGKQMPFSPLTGHENGINSVSITPDGSLLVSGSSDNTVRIWNINTGECFGKLETEKNVPVVQISPDSQFVTALTSEEIIIWNTETGKMVSRMSLGSSFNNFALSLDGKKAILSEGSRLAIWSPDHGCAEVIFELPKTLYVTTLAITPDGSIAACGSSDHIVRIFDIHKRTEIRTYRGHSQKISSVALRADGKSAVSASSDGTICVWDTTQASTPPIPVELQGKFRSLAIVRALKVALCQKDDGKIRFYMFEKGQDITLTDNMNWAIGPGGRFCFSRFEKGIKGWDMTSGRQYDFLWDEIPENADADKYPILTIVNLKVSAAGNRAISPGKDRIWIWDLINGKCIDSFSVPGELCAMSISTDGKLAAAAGSGNTRDSDFDIRIWDLDSLKLMHTLHQGGTVRALEFNPDCRSIIVGSDDGIINIWHTKTGYLLKTIGEKRSFLIKNTSFDIKGIRILQHGIKALILGSGSMTVVDLRSGISGPALDANVNSNNVLVTEITEDGLYAITGVGGQTLKIWDINTNQCVVVNAENTEILHLGSVNNQVAIINVDGKALFATFLNLPRGPFILTALPETSQPCPNCNTVVITPQTVTEKISSFERIVEAGLSPSMKLSFEAWDDVGLQMNCQNCGQPLMFNPFFASCPLDHTMK